MVGQLAPAKSGPDSSDASLLPSDSNPSSLGSSDTKLRFFDASKPTSPLVARPESSAVHNSSRHAPNHPQGGWICSNCNHEYVVESFESPIPVHLLNTNLPPLASEEHTLRETLSSKDIAGELTKTREAIRSLRVTLSALERHEAQLQQTFVASKGVFSLIRRIPREVIGEIILHAVGYYSSSMDRVSLNTKAGVWAYARVCQLWRSEVLSRAAVWSKVEITQNDFSVGAFRAVCARSHKIDLDLSIKLYEDTRASQHILGLLVDASQSWVRVRFEMNPKLFTCLKRLKNRVPKLQCLEIRYRSLGPGVTSTHFRDYLETAPALRHLTVQGIRYIDQFSLPWSQITHFCDYSQRHTLDLLHRMPQLTHYYGSYKSNRNEKITLPSLQSLMTWTTKLDLLITPNLKELHVAIKELGSLTNLIRRSSCTITTLTVDLDLERYREIPDEHVRTFILFCDEIPNLTTLYFHQPKSKTSTVGHQLLVPLADAACLPRLHSLVFDVVALESEETCKAIRQLAKQRCDEESPALQELHFIRKPHHESHSSEKDFRHLFDGLGAQGLKVLVTDNTIPPFPHDPQLYW